MDETNDYAEKYVQLVRSEHGDDWFPSTVNKIKVLLSLLALICIVKKLILESYWNRDLTTSTPFFPETMPRDRFLVLLRNLHFKPGLN